MPCLVMGVSGLREKTEWCHLRWYNADEPGDCPRVLLIGDSIVLGYHEVVSSRLRDTANLAVLTTSKAIDDPSLITETEYVFDGYEFDVVQFNNGLHGWHVADADYERHLMNYTEHIRQLSPRSTLIWTSTTPVTEPHDVNQIDHDMNERVIRRNRIASGVMTKCGVAVNDLYGLVLNRPELRHEDGLHYNDAGQEVLGQAVADLCVKWLGNTVIRG